MKIKNLKLKIIAAVLAVLVVSAVFAVTNFNTGPSLKKALEKTASFDVDDALTKKSIAEVDGLLELPEKEKAIVAQIKDKEALVEFNAIFERSYIGDLVIFLPTQTVIYDPATKTVRDISSIVLYQYVSKD